MTKKTYKKGLKSSPKKGIVKVARKLKTNPHKWA